MLPGISQMSSAPTSTSGATKIVFITSGTSFTVPSDFASLVSIEAIGGGSGGAGSLSGIGKGGGAGAYSKITALSGLVASGSVFVSIGTGGGGGTFGNGTSGGDTWLNKTSNAAPSATTDGLLAKVA